MKVIGLAFATLALVGCGAAELLASASPNAPGNPTPGPIALRTSDSPSASPCTGVDVEGTLTAHPVTGLELDNTGGVRMAVVWPFGYRATPSIGGAILFDASGNLVAYTGDRIRLQGSVSDEGGPLVVCGIV